MELMEEAKDLGLAADWWQFVESREADSEWPAVWWFFVVLKEKLWGYQLP